MIKKLIALCLTLFTAMAFAAVDVNKATQAELDSVKGIGPSIAGKIMDERKKAPFKDWSDFVERVKGVGEGNAAKFSAEGLTVNGAPFKGVAAKPAEAKKEAAPAAAAKADTAKPAAEASATDKKAAAAKEKADKAAEKKAAAEKEKADKKAAKEAAAAEAKKAKAEKDAKAAAPAASAAKK